MNLPPSSALTRLKPSDMTGSPRIHWEVKDRPLKKETQPMAEAEEEGD